MLYGSILAAGGSERMKGFPKPLLKINNRYFIEYIVSEINKVSEIENIYIVFGYKSEEILKKIDLLKYNTKVLINNDWRKGQLSSLKKVIEHLPEKTTGLLFTLVDHPLVRFETYKILSEAHIKQPDRIIIPTFRGRKGHPALFPSRVFKILLEEELPGGARELIYREGEKVIFIPVDDEGVIIDIDCPEDYERYIKKKAF